jgi:Mlc titration factor MtfA (ptsG expression regulator)
MLPSLILFLLLLLVIVYIWGHPLLTHYYHQQITKTPFPPLWQEILERRSPLYSHLPQPLQQRLQGKIQIFLNTKQFIGCPDFSR